jgi:glyoxylase-like metal-dependent hydrolase (beta-lactamase superfamily II)
LTSPFNKNTQPVIPVKLGIVNSFIVKGEKAVIVDTGYAGNAHKILRAFRGNSIKPEDVSLIILTHGHIDHYGSAYELKSKTGAPIAMHKADAEYLTKGINYVGVPTGLFGRIAKSLFIRADESISKPLKVDIVFDNEIDLREFGIDGRVIHTPGHTEGSVSLILSGGEAIVGDLLMGGILFKRVPHYPLFVSNMTSLRTSIKKIIELCPKIIYASHGGPFSHAIAQKFFKKALKNSRY